MLFFIRKGYDLGLDAWAITWTDALNLSVVEWGVVQSVSQNIVRFGIGISRPALELFQMAHVSIHIRELMEVVLTILCLHQVVMDAAAIDAYRCTGFHSVMGNAMTGDRFCQMIRCGFPFFQEKNGNDFLFIRK